MFTREELLTIIAVLRVKCEVIKDLDLECDSELVNHYMTIVEKGEDKLKELRNEK
jgi:hypothetical protein